MIMQTETETEPTTAAPVGRVTLIDVSNWAHKLIHATGSIDRAFATFQRWHATIADATGAERYVLAFDSPGASFRREVNTSYKASRKEPPAGVSELIEQVKQWAIAEGYDVAQADGFEADDIIATITAAAVLNRRQAIICSTDKDLRQLLQDGWVVIARTVTASKIEWYNEQELLKDFGLRPSQWVDFQTLVGDKSDNVAGCDRIGEKTACGLLQSCGTLDEHFVNPWRAKLTLSQRTALAKFRGERRDLARLMVKLRTDAPLGAGWAESWT